MDIKSLHILFEDKYLIAVDKPAGIHTAPLRPKEPPTLLSLVIEKYPEVAGVAGIKAIEPGLLHRLDRETSGIVIIARTEFSFRRLLEQFNSDRVKKAYTAVCAPAGKLSVNGQTLRVDSRFAPYGQGSKMVRVVLPSEKKRQLTRKSSHDTYTTEVKIMAQNGNLVLLLACLTRGFRHQARAHLAFLGFPIIGDIFYGVAVPPDFPERMYLHASQIKFIHPESGKPLIIESPLPPEFKAMFPAFA